MRTLLRNDAKYLKHSTNFMEMMANT